MRKLLYIYATAAALAITIATDHTDNSRISSVTETILTPANVKDPSFRKTCTYAVNGPVYAQPLYIPGITVAGALHNLLIVATMGNTIYAFDADSCAAALWTRSTGAAPYTDYTPFNGGLLYNGGIGCFATPVVDVAASKLYAVCATNTPTYLIYQLSLTTGAILGSTTITATASPSTASDAVAGTLTFDPSLVQQRVGLTLTQGNVYVMFGSFRDVAPWHGWIMAYSTTTLARTASFCTNPNTNGGGIWQSGGGAAVDGSGNLYVVTGNGQGTAYNGTTDWSESVLKFNASLVMQDWFTPSNWADLDAVDEDLGSSPPMLIPGTNLLVFGAKDYNIYSIDTTCMGHLGGTVGGCTAPQVFATGDPTPAPHLGVYGTMWMNGRGYFPNTAGNLFAFTLSGSTWNTTPVQGSPSAFPGAMITGSINGTSNPIVWAITANTQALTAPAAGALRALNAATLVETWNSTVLAGNAVGNIAKFTAPTVANGRVYVATYDNSVLAFGLSEGPVITGPPVISGPVVVQ